MTIHKALGALIITLCLTIVPYVQSTYITLKNNGDTWIWARLTTTARALASHCPDVVTSPQEGGAIMPGQSQVLKLGKGCCATYIRLYHGEDAWFAQAPPNTIDHCDDYTITFNQDASGDWHAHFEQ